MPQNSKCRLCPLGGQPRQNTCVWGDGPTDAQVVVIGEAPGEAEARTGKPFMGKSGQLLRATLDKVGIQNAYITNVVKCRPPDNRTPTPEEIKACRPYLEEELATIKPKFVLTVGAPASKTVLKKAKITEAHGQIVQMPDFVGMPAYHPAYCLRDPSKLPAFEHDLGRLVRHMRGESRNTGVRWSIVTSENLKKFFREFENASEFAYDVETTGLFPYDGKGAVRCLGLALPNRAWILPLQGVDKDYPDDVKSDFKGRFRVQKTILKLLAELSKGKVAIAHNGKFDNHWLMEYYGIRFHLNFDTMLAHHVLDENSDHDLKSLVRSQLDEPDYDLSTAEKKGDTSNRKLFEYCAKDTAYTLRLKRIFDAKFKKDISLRRLFYKLVMPAARTLEEIEEVGLTIDLPRRTQVERETRESRDEALVELNEMAGKEVNWNSPQQIAKLLFEDFGLKPTVLTAKGKPSTGEEALLDIKDQHPIATQLVRYRELDKFLGTYIEGWKEYMVEDRLFLGYKVHGTVTGRYASRLHQVPRDGRIRNLVTAPPGWIFAQGDISQAEMRTAAILSGDPELVRLFTKEIDVHWRTLISSLASGAAGEYMAPAKDTAFALLKKRNPTARRPDLNTSLEIMLKSGHEACIEVNKTWKEARKKAKAVNFGFLFGMFENKFIETCKLKYGFEPTRAEASAFRESYFSLYRGLKPWHDKQKGLARLDGFVRSLTGRLRRLPGVHSSDKMIRSEAERQAINSPVQGFIGDYKAMAMIEIHQTIPRDKLKIVGEHHDALLMIARIDSLHETLPRVKAILRRPKLLDTFKVKLTVPMEADIELGNWGAGKPWVGEKSSTAIG